MCCCRVKWHRHVKISIWAGLEAPLKKLEGAITNLVRFASLTSQRCKESTSGMKSSPRSSHATMGRFYLSINLRTVRTSSSTLTMISCSSYNSVSAPIQYHGKNGSFAFEAISFKSEAISSVQTNVSWHVRGCHTDGLQGFPGFHQIVLGLMQTKLRENLDVPMARTSRLGAKLARMRLPG